MVKSCGSRRRPFSRRAGNLCGRKPAEGLPGQGPHDGAEVLILDEATRGIDIGAKTEIYQLINQMAAQGIAVIMISSELPEILGISDRIYVMREGRISAEFDNSARNITQEDVALAATGGVTT